MSAEVTARRVRDAYERIARVQRPEVWISLRDEADVLAEALAVDPAMPLAGMLVAVKDNIDVAGLATTAACPAFAYEPAESAPAVRRLVEAGAVVLGKTNLDQFATGLVGARSPYGAVRDARRPEYVSGGSSSGSAVAVALGIADLGLATDTAGSGRVPAAFQGIVGVKPTRGLVPVRGVVPACRTLDCVSVLAVDLAIARRAAGVIAGVDGLDPLSRAWPADAPLGAGPRPRVAVPAAPWLTPLTADARRAFADAVEALSDRGAEVVEIDLEPFVMAARLLYAGALVAERHAAVGAFVDAHPGEVDPTVGQIIAAAGTVSGTAFATDADRVDRLRVAAMARLEGCDALMVPTTTAQPTIAEVAADPGAVNDRLGIYTNFCNLFDLCAVAVPAGTADGGQFGVTVLGRAFADAVAADVAALLGPARGRGPEPDGIELLVVGAHRQGQPLNGQLVERGARLTGVVETAPVYRLYALATEPPKPGLVWVTEDGQAIEGELWKISSHGLGTLLADLPAPMALGPVLLADGRTVVGFLCQDIAILDAHDITALGSWPAYLAAAR
jgi:allophanate hydrolase